MSKKYNHLQDLRLQLFSCLSLCHNPLLSFSGDYPKPAFLLFSPWAFDYILFHQSLAAFKVHLSIMCIHHFQRWYSYTWVVSQQLLFWVLVSFSYNFAGLCSTSLVLVTTLTMSSCSFIFLVTLKIVYGVHLLLTHHSTTFLSLFFILWHLSVSVLRRVPCHMSQLFPYLFLQRFALLVAITLSYKLIKDTIIKVFIFIKVLEGFKCDKPIRNKSQSSEFILYYSFTHLFGFVLIRNKSYTIGIFFYSSSIHSLSLVLIRKKIQMPWIFSTTLSHISWVTC